MDRSRQLLDKGKQYLVCHKLYTLLPVSKDIQGEAEGYLLAHGADAEEPDD